MRRKIHPLMIMSATRCLVGAALALAILPVLGLAVPASAQAIEQPARGSALRKTLLDAARPTFEAETNGPVEFVIRQLNVHGDWAFGSVLLQRPGGGAIDWQRTRYAEDQRLGIFNPNGSFFLLRRAGGAWTVVEFTTGPTDVAWDGWRQDHNLPMALFRR